jgi:hypothetical protein
VNLKKLTNSNPYPAMLQAGQSAPDSLFKERDMMVDLYKNHLKLLLEANIFIYAVTGALASFVITHTSIPHVRWVLLLPIVVCGGFAFLFVYVTFEIRNTKQELSFISEALNSRTFPAFDALPIGLLISAFGLAAIFGLLIAAIVWFPATVRLCP